jgi:hypothetical protein
MSRLFYHVMQDNAGNLLFDVSGTMRLAGSGTLATIYGDEALTVVLPNPMTNHPSFGSFKCFLGAGDYDFYMAKSGYTFETLTGVQGHGTLAQQDASAVAITGGIITSVSQLGTTGVLGVGGKATLANALDVGTELTVFGRTGLGTNPAAPYSLRTLSDAQVGGTLVVAVDISNSRDVFCGRDLSVAQQAYKPGGGPFVATSDVRLKTAIEEIPDALGVLTALHGIRYRWKDPAQQGHMTGAYYGLVAQEVATVVPEWVGATAEGYQTVGVQGFEALTAAALRQVVARLEALEALVAALRADSPA